MKRIATLISDYRPAAGFGSALVIGSLCLALAGCGDDTPEVGELLGGATQDEAREIPCALDGATEFDSICTRMVVPGDGGNQLILEGPDGSFRRLTILTDGRGLEATDGAQEPDISIIDNASIEVAIGGDRYRLPAKLRETVGANQQDKP